MTTQTVLTTLADCLPQLNQQVILSYANSEKKVQCDYCPGDHVTIWEFVGSTSFGGEPNKSQIFRSAKCLHEKRFVQLSNIIWRPA